MSAAPTPLLTCNECGATYNASVWVANATCWRDWCHGVMGDPNEEDTPETTHGGWYD